MRITEFAFEKPVSPAFYRRWRWICLAAPGMPPVGAVA
jgi:hypothetical protein